MVNWANVVVQTKGTRIGQVEPVFNRVDYLPVDQANKHEGQKHKDELVVIFEKQNEEDSLNKSRQLYNAKCEILFEDNKVLCIYT